jgi:prephenate dehydrogenase
VTVSQQKRRFNRLQDVLANTNARVVKQEKQFHDENMALSEVFP